MKLSICIPTYNRPNFLPFTLRRSRLDFPDADIVVSDDASPDVDWYDISIDDFRPLPGLYGNRWFGQTENIGPFPNMLRALTLAEGQYAVYCADDDYLLPEGIAEGIAYLDAHPNVVAYCAPCEIWDEVHQKTFWNAFKSRDRLFTQTQGMELFNFIIENHVWPEHLIYRTPVPLKPRTRAYWAFADLVDILATGDLYFSTKPFYRNLLVHPVGERVQLGNVQCLSFFDEYRGGLEVLAHGLFGAELPHKTRRVLQDMIQAFICSRMHTAARLYVNQGNEAEAMMLLKRLSVANPMPDVIKSTDAA